MLTIYDDQLRKSRGQIIGWGLTLFLLGLMLVSFYDTISDQSAQFEQLLAVYPEEFKAFFGDFTQMTTPEGFLGIEFFSYMPLLLGIYACLSGSGLLASDEESGRLDLIMGQPISRSRLFFGRFLGFLTATAAICGIGWLGIVLPMTWSTMDLSPIAVARPLVAVFAVVMIFGALALFLSLSLPSRRIAATLSSAALVFSFFIQGFSGIIDELKPVAKWLPMAYYQGSDAIHGLDASWTLGLLGAAAAFTAAAWFLFEKRDLRVGGEGGWGPLAAPRRGRGIRTT